MPRLQPVLSQVSPRFTNRQSVTDPLNCQGIFRADVQKSGFGPQRQRSDQHPFDHPEGERFEDHPVHKGAGIAFIAVANDIFDRVCRFGNHAPFLAGGKPAPSPAAQAAFFNGFDDLLRRAVFQTFIQRGKPAPGAVFVDIERIQLSGMLGDNLLLRRDIGGIRAEPRVDGSMSGRLPDPAGQESVQQVIDCNPAFSRERFGTEVSQQNAGNLCRGYLSVLEVAAVMG